MCIILEKPGSYSTVEGLPDVREYRGEGSCAQGLCRSTAQQPEQVLNNVHYTLNAPEAYDL